MRKMPGTTPKKLDSFDFDVDEIMSIMQPSSQGKEEEPEEMLAQLGSGFQLSTDFPRGGDSIDPLHFLWQKGTPSLVFQKLMHERTMAPTLLFH